MFHTYVLRSQTTGRYYIGSTDNLEQRLTYHNTNETKYTRGKGPWDLAWSERHDSRSEAVKREREIKGWKNRPYMEKTLGLNPRSVGESVPMQSGRSDVRVIPCPPSLKKEPR